MRCKMIIFQFCGFIFNHSKISSVPTLQKSKTCCNFSPLPPANFKRRLYQRQLCLLRQGGKPRSLRPPISATSSSTTSLDISCAQVPRHRFSPFPRRLCVLCLLSPTNLSTTAATASADESYPRTTAPTGRTEVEDGHSGAAQQRLSTDAGAIVQL